MPTCCQGCVSKPDVTFFEFPTSRLLRKRWLDAMPRPPPPAPPALDDARLCSLHFAVEDYEEVRGRVRLKRKVVPTIFGDQSNKPQTIKDPLGSLDSADAEKEQSKAETDKQTTCNDNHPENVDKPSENVDKHIENIDNHTENVDKPSENVDKHVENIDNHRENDNNLNENVNKHSADVDNHSENVDNRNENVGNHSENVCNLKKSNDNQKVDDNKVKSETELPCSKDVTENGHVDNNNKDVATVSNDNKTVSIDIKNIIEKANGTENTDKPMKRKVKKKIVPMRKVPFKLRKMSEDSEDSVNSEEPPPPLLEDLEEHLPNYHIANMKTERQVAAMADSSHQHVILSEDQEEGEEMVLTPHVPVYIELSVGQDGSVEAGGQQNDCLMVMESVQCDVDVALMLEAREEGGEGEGGEGQGGVCVNLDDDDDDDDVTFLREDRAASPERSPKRSPKRSPGKRSPSAAISLLTSSDEDDVILQEPHVDCLSVSDETDEDDVPLLQLVHKQNQPQSGPNQTKTTKNVLLHQRDHFCVLCNHVSLTRADYNLHRRGHERDAGSKSPGSVVHVCRECGFTSYSRSQLRRHQKTHNGEKGFRCSMCSYRSKYNMSLHYHLNTHDLHPNVYNCGACGHQLDSRERLLEHQGVCDKLGGKFTCSSCGYNSRDKRALKVHKKTVHKTSGT